MREVLKPDAVGSMLIDSPKEEGNEEVTDVVTSEILELEVPASLEYPEVDSDETLLDCGTRRLEEVENTIELDGDSPAEDVIVSVGLENPGVEAERLIEKSEADWVVHVALSSGG